MNGKTIRKIMDRLEKNPTQIITSNLGSGCHARTYKTADGEVMHKVVLPGDTFETALVQLHFLLFDLGVDVGLTDEELKTLELK